MEPAPRRRTFTSRSRADRLRLTADALRALETHPEIGPALRPAGYGPDGIAEGRALFDAATASTTGQGRTRAARLTLTAEQTTALTAAVALYRPLAARARVIFKGRPDVLAGLGLTGRRSTGLAARLEHMRHFSAEAQRPDLAADFAARNAPAARFDALDRALDALAQTAENQDIGTADAQHTTDTRKAAFRHLDTWMTTLHGHARIELADRPQLLEALGLSIR